MSRHSLIHFAGTWKRLACTVSGVSVAALLLLLPQAKDALAASAVPVRAAAERLLRPANLLLPGTHDFWHTEGNGILDRHDHTIRIAGMNWSGLETREAVPGGLEAQDYRSILRTIQANGYNTIRIPFSNEMVEAPIIPAHIRFSNSQGPINTDLRGLTSIEILDQVVSYAGRIGLKVILDNHRSEAGSSAEESGLWYTSQYPETAWIADWTALATRYRNTSTVIGMDLRNEPHNAEKGGSCWDCGGPRDWHRAATRAGNAILAVNPRLLIFVEGVDTYAGDTYWWGGNLEGVRRSPVQLSIPNRLVYSAHEYGPTEYPQPWFNTATSSQALAEVWRRHWAFISEAGLAPVWIGEFGTPNGDADVKSQAPGSEGQWFTSLVAFLAAHPALNWTYWGINGEDRYGLLDGAYSNRPLNALKAEALASISNHVPNSSPALTASVPQPFPVTYPTTPPTFRQPGLSPTIALTSPDRSLSLQPVQLSTTLHPESAHTRNSIRRLRTHSLTPSAEESVEGSIAASIHHAVSRANQDLTRDSQPGTR